MATIEDEKIKKNLLNRLKTVKGHLGGIENMIEQNKDCVDILVQISAVKSSINKIGLSLIENNVCNCIVESIEQEEEIDEAVQEAIESILKFTK